MADSNLQKYLDRKVSELIKCPPPQMSDGIQERHRLYSLGLMSILHYYWNGLKKGRAGEYPLNPDPSAGRFMLDDYRGHNIAGFAVDKKGEIMDFEFNHNRLFNSSAEHAEARLVRRIYSLNQIQDSWVVGNPGKPLSDYNTFEEVTVYTSLESCSQCSGIMALARVREVIYLQTDPGMYQIGNILRNLTADTPLESPIPVPASAFGLEHFTRLDQAFAQFAGELDTSPFHIAPDGKKDTTVSITSFLCTRFAHEIYADAAAELASLAADPSKLQFPDTLPRDRKGNEYAAGLTNAGVLAEVIKFRDYATNAGRRATPH